MSIKMIAAMMGAGLMATSALAETPRSAGDAAPVAAGTTQSATTTNRSDTQRYCVVQRTTGSILDQKICHTRAEWLDRGFDPLAAK